MDQMLRFLSKVLDRRHHVNLKAMFLMVMVGGFYMNYKPEQRISYGTNTKIPKSVSVKKIC